MREPESEAGDASSSQSPELNPSVVLCRRCGVDLAPLIRLQDQAIWHHRQAIRAWQVGDYATAMVQNDQALQLDANNADFHAFAGQLWGLQGEVQHAIAAWKTACQLNPQQPTARQGLQCFDYSFCLDSANS
jgi:tetratricopeptide (TPR) repeat protein